MPKAVGDGLTVFNAVSGDVLTPPPFYGGTEKFADLLSRQLAARGRHVMVASAGGSTVADGYDNIELLAVCDMPVSQMPGIDDWETRFAAWGRCADEALRHLLEMDQKPDVVINNMGHLLLDRVADLPRDYAELFTRRSVTVMHGRLDIEEEAKAYAALKDFQYVGISNAQVESLDVNWVDMIHHGIDLGQFTPRQREDKAQGDEEYILHYGRMCRDKGTDWAVRAAKEAGARLRLVGKIDRNDRTWVDEHVMPYVDGKQITYEGEVGPEARDEWMGRAALMLHANYPFPEPFGYGLVEALATGTGAAAYNRGSIPEILGAKDEYPELGFVCDSFEDFVEAIGLRGRTDPQACRRHVEENFTAERMGDDYDRLIQKLAG